jgi:hypothetical protein
MSSPSVVSGPSPQSATKSIGNISILDQRILNRIASRGKAGVATLYPVPRALKGQS